MQEFVLRDLLAESKDGEWGKGELADGLVEMLVIRGTDFESVRVGDLSGVPRRFIPKRIADRKALRPYDLLIETAGGSKDRPTGRTLLLKLDIFRKSVLPVTCASFARFLRVDPARADAEYVFWLLQAMYESRQLLKYHTQHTGVARYQFTTFADNEPLVLPDVATQRRIASILSAYDDLIENNTRRIAILEEMARRIYEEWFVRFRFPGHDQVQKVASELGLIPEGWKVQTVEQTFQILGGGTPSKAEPAYWEGGTINWYSPTDLTRAGTSFMEQSADRITALGLAKSSAKLFPPMSVMLTSRATIGVVAINTNEACTNQGFITCLPNSDYPLWLLYHWLKANVETFIGLGTGATFKEITKGTFKGIRLLVPPQNLVGAFSSTSEQLMLLSLNLQRKNRNLRATRDLLLPKLISGELDVSTLSEPTV
jgi:type I restriction enzyme S subunit